MNDDDNIIDFGEEAKKRAGKLKTILGGIGKLSPVEFGQRRDGLIAELGVSRSDLDKEYRERRKATKKADNGGGKEFGNAIEPWDSEVDGQRLLSDLVAAIKSHLVLPVGAAETVALWIIFTHCFDAFEIAPVLGITSPTPECGKTTVLTLLSAVVPKPLQSSNVTASVVFRAVEKWSPTLLIDEADTFLRDSDELRGVINSGHNRRSAFIIRNVGEDFEPKQFSTWSPKAISMIGKMHPTLSSRCVHIQIQRKMPTETVEPLRPDRLAHLEPLARKAARWSADNLSALRASDPELPPSLYSRIADNWRPLIAIADLIGGEWPHRARRIAEGFAASASDDTKAILLLDDIRSFFERTGADGIHSDDIIAELEKMEDRPWAEWSRGKPITKNQLAKMLAGFEVKPKQVWANGKNKNGYALSTLKSVFIRYLASRTLESLPDKELRAGKSSKETTDLEENRALDPLKANGSSTLEVENPQNEDFDSEDPFDCLRDPSNRINPK
jgi:uncharacterized protein DUF3631